GRLPRATTLAALAQAVKVLLNAGPVQAVGDPAQPVERVALACGAGGGFLHDAARGRADVLLTRQARLHGSLAAGARGRALVLPGHYATERWGVEELAGRLQAQFPEVQVWASSRERDPASWV